jgi:type IV secretion system protein VirB4
MSNDALSSELLWGQLVHRSPPVLLNTNGSLSTVILYRPRDLSLTSDTERSIYFDRLDSLFSTFGTHYHLHFDSHTDRTSSYLTSTWTNPAAAFLDALHALPFSSSTLQETDYYLTVTQTIPRQTKTKLFDIFSPPRNLSPAHDEEVSLFLDRVQTFTTSLSTLFPYASLATADHLCTYFHRTVSWSHYPVSTPEHPYDLASQLTDTPLLPGYTPALGFFDEDNQLIDGNYIRPISIKSWPLALTSIIPSILQHLPFPYRLSTLLSPLDFADAKALLKDLHGKWKWTLTSLSQAKERAQNKTDGDATDQSQLNHVASAKQALADLEAQLYAFGYLTPTIFVHAPTTALLTIRTREVVSLLQSSGCTLLPEDVGATDTYLASLPCHTSHTPRTIPAPVPAATFLVPHTAVWSGPSCDDHYNDGPLFTASSDGYPFRFALHPPNSEVGNTMVIGPTRTGKSGLLGFMMSQFHRYHNSQIFCFDKDYQLYGTTLLHNGNHFDLCSSCDDRTGFAPFAQLGSSDAENVWCLNWITQLFSHQGLPPTPDEKNDIETALRHLAGFPARLRTLTGFAQLLQAPRLLPALTPYLQGHAYGFFDASHDSLSLSSFTTFEMRHLLTMPDALPHALRYIFHRLSSRFDGSPTLIVLDECRKLFADPVFSAEVVDYSLERAKANVAMVLATNEIVNAGNADIWQTIKSSVKTWLYLPNDTAEDLSVTPFYADCGLSPTHCAVLARSTPKQDYLYQSGADIRRFQLTLSPIERLLCAASTVDEIAQFRALASSNLTEPLLAAWLRLHGYHEEADVYNEHYVKDYEDDIQRFCNVGSSVDASRGASTYVRLHTNGHAVPATNGVHA